MFSDSILPRYKFGSEDGHYIPWPPPFDQRTLLELDDLPTAQEAGFEAEDAQSEATDVLVLVLVLLVVVVVVSVTVVVLVVLIILRIDDTVGSVS